MSEWKVHVEECVFLAEASIYNEPRVSLATISNFPSPTQLPPPFFWACFKRESFTVRESLVLGLLLTPKEEQQQQTTQGRCSFSSYHESEV
jgi:hypothetical protein